MRTLAATGSATAKPTDLTAVILEAITLVRMANPTSFDREPVAYEQLGDGRRVQIQQVVVNLLKNALEAMSDLDHPQVSIFITTEGRAAIIRVEDNGPGYLPKDLDTFVRWFVTTNEKGSGIGLPISEKSSKLSGALCRQRTRMPARLYVILPLARGSEQKKC